MFTGQLVKTRSIKDDDLSVTRVGSFIICLKSLAEIIDLNSLLLINVIIIINIKITHQWDFFVMTKVF